MTVTGRPAHIQRCTYQQLSGDRYWQCTQPDPHPSGEGHRFPIDAQFGRVLHEQPRDWLAATLRDREALRHHTQKRADDLQSIAMDLVGSWAYGTPVRRETGEWIRVNAPVVAARLDEQWMGTDSWHS